MSIDICITTHHSPNKLAKCLSAITQHANNVEYNVLLWCNEADDEDRKAI
jgi:GT2 family glycosyltransferase